MFGNEPSMRNDVLTPAGTLTPGGTLAPAGTLTPGGTLAPGGSPGFSVTPGYRPGLVKPSVPRAAAWVPRATDRG